MNRLKFGTTDSCNDKNNMTLLSAFQLVLQKCKKCGLRQSYFDEAKPELDFIKDRLNTNMVETTILAVVISHGPFGKCSGQHICDYLGIDGMEMLTREKDFLNLLESRLLCKGIVNKDFSYSISDTLHDFILNNGDNYSESELYYCKEEVDFFKRLNKLFNQKYNHKIDLDYLGEECVSLLLNNHHLDFALNADIMTDNLSVNEVALFLLFCIFYYSGKLSALTSKDWMFLFDNHFDADILIKDLKSGKSNITRQGLVERYQSKETIKFKLSKKCTDKLFPDILADFFPKNDDVFFDDDEPFSLSKNVVKHSTITHKELFYNPETQTQVETLSSALKGLQFAKIQQRLRKAGMKGGLCCLFYGDAGAGKTELAKQLAKQSQRDIILVDASQLRSKWVGETEKNVQAVFDLYKKMLKPGKRQPILLFNEADSIMNRRMVSAERSIDKMENAIANIILQNMEDFDDGILIATTNLAETNLDPAYERRFLYKVRFERPNPQVRRNIWGSLLGDVDSDVLDRLSQEYEFTGGQIANIQKKKIVGEILTGDTSSYCDLKDYCEQERISGSKQNPIGFRQ